MGIEEIDLTANEQVGFRIWKAISYHPLACHRFFPCRLTHSSPPLAPPPRQSQCIIIRSLRGYVKRLPLGEFDAQQRGTRGKAGMTNLKYDDAVVQMEQCMTHDKLLWISDAGVAYALPAYKVPQRESLRTSDGFR